MKRPQSAKPAKMVKPYWAQTHEDESYTVEDQPTRFNQLRNKKKYLLQGVSVSNSDLSRLVPKRIPHDKERLYQESIALKNKINEVSEENTRLKTKVAILEREREGAQCKGGRSGKLAGLAFHSDKENSIISNFKKMLREQKEKYDILASQLTKLKKTLRYTKLNELEIEKQAVYEENKRQALLNEALQIELERRFSQQAEIDSLNQELRVQLNEVKQLTKDNLKFEEILEDVEMQNKRLHEQLLVQEKKINRNNDIEKRKFQQLARQNERLKNQANILHTELQQLKKKQTQQQRQRPASCHPQTKLQGSSVSDREKQAALIYNERLEKEIKEAKQQLIESESRLKQSSSRPLALSQDEEIEFELTKNDTSGLQRFKKQRERDSYEADFQLTPQKNSKPQSRSNNQREDLFESAVLGEVRELLTYRMKYHRYTFQELKADILEAPMNTFNYADLLSMLQNEPFFLSPHYASQFLRACFGGGWEVKEEMSASRFITNLREVIEEFRLLEEEEEEQMLYKIADFMTKHRSDLEQQFRRKYGSKLLSKTQVTEILQNYGELSKEEIDLTICYISVTSPSLSAISHQELLDKFFINSSHSNPSRPLPRSRPLSPSKWQPEDEELSLGENEGLEEEEDIFDDELI